MAAKKSTSKALATMDSFTSKWEKQAVEDSARTGASGDGNKISIKGGSFTYRESDLGTEMEVVILDWSSVKAYYDSPYDPDERSSPACWAIGKTTPNQLTPSDKSPLIQCDTCAACELNQFGSAERGKGKACSDKRRLLVVPVDELADLPVEEIEAAIIEVPATSCRNFDKFVNGVAKLSKRPTFAITTVISFDEEIDYPALLFKPNELIGDVAIASKIEQLREMHEEAVMHEYDPEQYKTPAPKGRGVGKKGAPPAKKKAAGGKSKFAK